MLENFFQLDNGASAAKLGDTDAIDARFSHSTELINAICTGMEVPSRSETFQGRTFRQVKFNQSRFHQMTFKDCRFEDCLFVGCDFQEVEFHDTMFSDCNFYKATFRDVYLDIRLVSFAKPYQATHSNVMLGFYQAIYDNYADAHQWKFSLFADIERRRWDGFQLAYKVRQIKFRGEKEKWPAIKSWLSKSTARWGNWLSHVVICHGYGPFRFLAWTALILVGISYFVQTYWSNFGFGNCHDTAHFSDAFFYVVTIWSTLCYSAATPSTDFGLYTSSAIGFLGLTWTGLFIAILIRRFVR